MTATTPYRPANGSEGLVFEHRFCRRCIHDKATRQDPPVWENGCQIWALAFIYSANDPEYPIELVRDADDVFSGRCTAFSQDPDEPVFDPDVPRGFPLPSEIAGAYLQERYGEATE
ncbi:MAG TPA: hypothetical protein VJB57_11685 [Dehalococcoidia bacterium]|nr:hypothetical protein [Dehalococcoidia bacterium]